VTLRLSVSRRQALETVAGGTLLLAGYGTAARAQAVKRIDRYIAELDQIIDVEEPILELGTGFGGGGNAEGPVWWQEGGYLLFASIGDNKLIKYEPGKGTSVFKTPTGGANGHTRDTAGRMISCEGLNRRVTREEKDGSITVVCNSYQGKRINKPNDVVAASDGSIYFTDPWYGRMKGFGVERPRRLGFQGVYRVTTAGALELLVDRALFDQPNGLCFSPDEARLYVNDSENALIRVFTAEADGAVSGGEVFASGIRSSEEPGGPDGMKCDASGHVWVTAPGGLWVYAPSGELVGKLRIPEPVANLAWGGNGFRTLFLTATRSVYAVLTRVGPRREPYMASAADSL